MVATIRTLPHYFPEIFVSRIIISVIAFALFCAVSLFLYKRQKFNKIQCFAAILLSLYIVVLLYFTVVGRYSHEEYGYEIGDEIKLEYGDETYTYLITGLLQTTNNDGKEALISIRAAEHLIDFTYAPAAYNFDCDDKEVAQKVLDDCTEEFGDHIVGTVNFWEVIEGSMTTFKSIAALMLVLVCAISAAVILLVLFLLIKSFLYSKRRDYGILKAIGYTSNNLILQTALSFMPPIIVSVLVFSVASYFAANPYMNMMMSSFGIMKANFTIPVPGVVIVGAGIVLISFLFAVFEARRIKKIEAYKILIAE